MTATDMRSLVRPAWFPVLLAIALALTGCAGGSRAALPAGGTSGTSSLAVQISVPLAGAPASTLRRPAYVSPATQSLVIAASHGAVRVGSAAINLNAGTPGCQEQGSTLSCSVSVPLALTASGAYTLLAATYDAQQKGQCVPSGSPVCSGNELSSATVGVTLDVGRTNDVSLVLGGVVASISAQPAANGFLFGSAGAGLQLAGPQPQTVVLAALDADGYTIVGSGAPSLSLTSNAPGVTVTPVSAGVFTVQAGTGGSPPVVTPVSSSLTVTATPSGGAPYVTNIPLTVEHSAIFVSNGTTVGAFLDGNTTASLNLGGPVSPRGVAVDASGTVYVANHTSPGSVTECTAASGYASCTNPISGPDYPEGIALDAGGNLWLAASGDDDVVEYLNGQTSPNLTLPAGLSALRGVAVDSNGNLWAADQNADIVAGFAPPLTGLSTPFATLTQGISAPIELAAGPSGSLWVANCGTACGGGTTSAALEFATPIGSASSPALSVGAIYGVDKPEGVAVDLSGTLWIADSGTNAVIECPPPQGTVSCFSFSVPGALWIAAYPSEIDP